MAGEIKVIADAVRKQVAVLALAGKSRPFISKKLNITRYMVDKIYRDEEFKRVVKEIGDATTEVAKQAVRSQVSELVKDAFESLKHLLQEKKSVEAIKVFLRIVGLEDKEVNKGGGDINLILPTTKVEKPVTAQEIPDDKRQE